MEEGLRLRKKVPTSQRYQQQKVRPCPKRSLTGTVRKMSASRACSKALSVQLIMKVPCRPMASPIY